MPSQLTVDLDLEPASRWRLSPAQIKDARRLIDLYNRDLGVDDTLLELMTGIAEDILSPSLREEIHSLAHQLGVPFAHALAGNLHYDAIKSVWGCTAFAVDTPDGPLHARNLDWVTQDRVLNDTSMTTTFANAPAGEFITVGWPGFAGVLSGMAPGRFAVTLNAVMSEDTPVVAQPVVFLIRDVLETAATYGEALIRLRQSPIASDCLILLSGTQHGEMAVIERTPTRSAVRTPSNNAIFVTNDYLALDSVGAVNEGVLQMTSCGRREQIERLLRTETPTPEAAFKFLSDSRVQMQITVQQMAFVANSGLMRLRIP